MEVITTAWVVGRIQGGGVNAILDRGQRASELS